MTQSFLGGRDSVVLRTGQPFIHLDGAGQKPLSLGDIEVANMSVENDIEAVNKPFKGRRIKIRDIVRETGGNITMTLLNFNARHLALATSSTQSAFTQDAETGETVTVTSIVPGELTDLGFIRVSNVVVTDSSSETLVESVDYIVDKATGTITWLKEITSATVTFDVSSITSADNVSVLSLLTRPEGVRATLTIVGEDSEGNSWKFVGVTVEIRSESDIPLISDEVAKIELNMTLVKGPDPQNPFGRSIEIPKAA